MTTLEQYAAANTPEEMRYYAILLKTCEKHHVRWSEISQREKAVIAQEARDAYELALQNIEYSYQNEERGTENMQEPSRVILGLRARGWSDKDINDFILWAWTGDEKYRPAEEIEAKE